jgi:hypothetical protein
MSDPSGTPKFLANPDLAVRLRLGAHLDEPIRETHCGGDGPGYVDYPALTEPAERSGGSAAMVSV